MSREKIIRGFTIVSFAVSLLLLLLMSKELFVWLVKFVFNEPREDMSHGWVVPFFTIYLFVLKHKEIRREMRNPSWVGLLAVVFGLFLFALGMLGDQIRITQIGAIWTFGFFFYALWGKRCAMSAAFPVLYLLFTVPTSFLSGITVKLRLIISVLASVLLNGFGIPVERVGTGLFCLSGGGFSLDIADPCSGLRSIVAISALTAAYAYLTQKTSRGKWLLFVSSVPIAMLANLIRIFSIAFVARIVGQEWATGFYHDYSGYLVFLIAILAMCGLGNVIAKWFKKFERDPKVEEEAKATRMSFASSVAITVILPLVVLSTFVCIVTAPRPISEPKDFLGTELYALDGFRMKVPYFCQSDQCGRMTEVAPTEPMPAECPDCHCAMDRISLGEKNILPTDTTIMKANYYDEMTGDAWRISVVINGKSRQSIHRPEVCLPAQGFSIEDGHIENFKFEGGGGLPVHCMEVRVRNTFDETKLGHGYFFVCANHIAASHLKRIAISIRDRALYRRITRWAMVTISGEEPFTTTDERREVSAAFLEKFSKMLFSNGVNNLDGAK